MVVSPAHSLSKAMHFIVGEYFYKLSFEDSPQLFHQYLGSSKANQSRYLRHLFEIIEEEITFLL